MTTDRTAKAYATRLRRVMDHIHSHLDEPLDLDQLASIACFSPYHFHRTYRILIGETVAETIARLRLQRASTALAHSARPVPEIAKQARYGSMAAFSRAFRATYGETPAAFRAASFADGDSNMSVAIQHRSPMRLVVVQHVGPAYQIGQAFDRLVVWAGPRGLLKPTARGVAVYLDDMGSTPAEEQRALAGLTVHEDVEGDSTVSIHTVPGGRHAVILHKGPYATIGESYRELYQYLSRHEQEPADEPLFEVNLNNPRNTAPEDLLTEICVPLK